jgi:pimeloyl-ACP methyl ester carboxylesterase
VSLGGVTHAGVPQNEPVKPLAAVLVGLALLGSACATAEPRGSASPPPSEPPAAEPPSASASPSAGEGAGPRPPSPLTWTSCEQGFECATLQVPRVATDPAQGLLDLALTRRPAGDPGQRIGSLVVNPGGPGASAVGYLQGAWKQVPPGVRARFDLVAFDPRGVGQSSPVRCGTTAELDRYFAIDPTPDDAAELQALQVGTEQLVAGCAQRSGEVLPYVSTADAAADLDAVREAVGDERLTYLGYSYGTALGAAYLDRFPTRVRAMVLDGGLDPALSWDQLLEGQSSGFDRALEAFLADCDRTRCAFRKKVTGPLGAAYDRLAARIDASPIPGEGARTVGPGEFSLGVGAGLYSKDDGWPAIAAALTAAVDGDGGILLQLNDSYLERTREGYANISEANLSVNCIDRPWPRDAAPYLALAERVRQTSPRFGPAIALSGLACRSWPVPPSGQPHPVSGAGAPPVVVIGTTGDPATPFQWSVALADQLESGVLITHRGDGHTVYRTGAPECVRGPVDRYLLTGTAPEALTC